MEFLNILWSWWFVSRTIFFFACQVMAAKKQFIAERCERRHWRWHLFEFFAPNQTWIVARSRPISHFSNLPNEIELFHRNLLRISFPEAGPKRCRSISGAMNLNCGQECLEFSASIPANHKIESCRILLFALSFRIICQKTANTWVVYVWDAEWL